MGKKTGYKEEDKQKKIDWERKIKIDLQKKVSPNFGLKFKPKV